MISIDQRLMCPIQFQSWTFLMAYPKAKLTSSGDTAYNKGIFGDARDSCYHFHRYKKASSNLRCEVTKNHPVYKTYPTKDLVFTCHPGYRTASCNFRVRKQKMLVPKSLTVTASGRMLGGMHSWSRQCADKSSRPAPLSLLGSSP
jgi:hypothetical protein